MKTLLLIRHAKSGWDDPSLSDIERKLTDRGKSDAKIMAKRLQERSIKIDACVSSTAKRAKKTAKIFMEEFEKDKKKLEDDARYKLLNPYCEPCYDNHEI